MEFQTRSEENGIGQFHSLNEALDAAEQDESIWKISFKVRETNENFRLIKTENGWILEDIYGKR